MKALIGYETQGVIKARLLAEIRDVVHQVDLQKLRNKIKAHIDQRQQEQKKRYDRTRRDATKYKDGDLVLVQITSDPATGSSRKLHPKFKGSFRIRKIVLINDRYEVKDLRKGRKQSQMVLAADNIKPWITIQRKAAAERENGCS